MDKEIDKEHSDLDERVLIIQQRQKRAQLDADLLTTEDTVERIKSILQSGV
jgi:hypothetical protein